MEQMTELVDKDVMFIILFHVLKKELQERPEQSITELFNNLQNPFCHIMEHDGGKRISSYSPLRVLYMMCMQGVGIIYAILNFFPSDH